MPHYDFLTTFAKTNEVSSLVVAVVCESILVDWQTFMVDDCGALWAMVAVPCVQSTTPWLIESIHKTSQSENSLLRGDSVVPDAE